MGMTINCIHQDITYIDINGFISDGCVSNSRRPGEKKEKKVWMHFSTQAGYSFWKTEEDIHIYEHVVSDEPVYEAVREHRILRV